MLNIIIRDVVAINAALKENRRQDIKVEYANQSEGTFDTLNGEDYAYGKNTIGELVEMIEKTLSPVHDADTILVYYEESEEQDA